MKELCGYIKKDGNFIWLIRLFFSFVILGTDLLMFVDPDLNISIRILIPAMLSYTACILKYDSITQVNDWGEKQIITEGLLYLPVSRQEILKAHFLELLKTEIYYFILWCVMHMIFVRELEILELIWILLIFAIPGLVILTKEGYILHHMWRKNRK